MYRVALALASLLVTSLGCYATEIDFPAGYVPFTSIYYVSGPDASGYSIVEGRTDAQGMENLYYYLQSLPSVTGAEAYGNQPIELAPGQYFSNVLVPTNAERYGDFRDFGGQIFDPRTSLDPSTAFAYASNIIPVSELFDPFAFRIGPATASPSPEPSGLAALGLLAGLSAAAYRRIRHKTIESDPNGRPNLQDRLRGCSGITFQKAL